MEWTKLSEAQKEEKLGKLQEICSRLIIYHPDYSSFKTVKIKFPSSERKQDKGNCLVKWNGKRFDEASGWGLVTREFPIEDLQEVTRRYSDKLQHAIKSG